MSDRGAMSERSADLPTPQEILQAAQAIGLFLTEEAAERLSRGESMHPGIDRHHFLAVAPNSAAGCDGICFGRVKDCRFCFRANPPGLYVCCR